MHPCSVRTGQSNAFRAVDHLFRALELHMRALLGLAPVVWAGWETLWGDCSVTDGEGTRALEVRAVNRRSAAAEGCFEVVPLSGETTAHVGLANRCFESHPPPGGTGRPCGPSSRGA